MYILKSIIIKILYFSLFSFCFFGCLDSINEKLIDIDNEDSSISSIFVDTDNNVYISGEYNNKACYWNNGEKYFLSNNYYSKTTSIFINNNDIYITGKDCDEACYWKNNSKIDLTTDNENKNTELSSIYINNDDVYISGFISIHDDIKGQGTYYNKSISFYYNNDVYNQIINENVYTYATSVKYYNGDIYIGGFYEKSQKNFTTKSPYIFQYTPCYWINNELVDLTFDGYSAEVKSIFLYDNQLYATGSYRIDGLIEVGCYWIGNKMYDLPNINKNYFSFGNSIYVDNDIVYIAGSDGSKACYWKNNNKIILDDNETSNAKSIFIANNTVYVAGIKDYKAMYWKDENCDGVDIIAEELK